MSPTIATETCIALARRWRRDPRHTVDSFRHQTNSDLGARCRGVSGSGEGTGGFWDCAVVEELIRIRVLEDSSITHEDDSIGFGLGEAHFGESCDVAILRRSYR